MGQARKFWNGYQWVYAYESAPDASEPSVDVPTPEVPVVASEPPSTLHEALASVVDPAEMDQLDDLCLELAVADRAARPALLASLIERAPRLADGLALFAAELEADEATKP